MCHAPLLRSMGMGLAPCRGVQPCRLTTACLPVLPFPSGQVLFQDGRFQWDRLENLLQLAKEGSGGSGPGAGGGLDLSTTVSDGARVSLAVQAFLSWLARRLWCKVLQQWEAWLRGGLC